MEELSTTILNDEGQEYVPLALPEARRRAHFLDRQSGHAAVFAARGDFNNDGARGTGGHRFGKRRQVARAITEFVVDE